MSLNTAKLPPDTAELWQICEHEPLLSGFYLMGGTALALQIQHRISEDLDFFYPHPLLPIDQLERFFKKLKRTGKIITHQANWTAYEEFKQAGESLFDYHQSLTVSGTKCSFTATRAFDSYTQKLLVTPPNPQGPAVPAVAELFDTKAVVVSQREKTRDWLDLYILMKNYHFTVADFHRAYAKVGMADKSVAAFEKMGRLPLAYKDEGYQTLVQPAPTLQEMRDFFRVKLVGR